MLTCECCLHFPREVALFWGRRITGPYVLFLANRSLSLLSLVVQLSALGPMSEKVSSIDHILISPVLMTLFPDTEVRESVNNMSITRRELRDLTLIHAQLCRSHKRYHNDYVVAVLLLGRSVNVHFPSAVLHHPLFLRCQYSVLRLADVRALQIQKSRSAWTAPGYTGVHVVSRAYRCKCGV